MKSQRRAERSGEKGILEGRTIGEVHEGMGTQRLRGAFVLGAGAWGAGGEGEKKRLSLK